MEEWEDVDVFLDLVSKWNAEVSELKRTNEDVRTAFDEELFKFLSSPAAKVAAARWHDSFAPENASNYPSDYERWMKDWVVPKYGCRVERSYQNEMKFLKERSRLISEGIRVPIATHLETTSEYWLVNEGDAARFVRTEEIDAFESSDPERDLARVISNVSEALGRADRKADAVIDRCVKLLPRVLETWPLVLVYADRKAAYVEVLMNDGKAYGDGLSKLRKTNGPALTALADYLETILVDVNQERLVKIVRDNVYESKELRKRLISCGSEIVRKFAESASKDDIAKDVESRTDLDALFAAVDADVARCDALYEKKLVALNDLIERKDIKELVSKDVPKKY